MKAISQIDRRRTERRGMPGIKPKPRTEMATRTETAMPQTGLTNKQNIRLLIALSLLLVALVVVLVKDREFWFGSEQAVESVAAPEAVARANSTTAPAKAVQSPVAPVARAKNHVAPKSPIQTAIAEPSKAAADTTSPNSASPVVSTKRVVLPPLDVEVVAGDSHRTVRPGSNVAKVQIPGDSNRAAAASTQVASLPANAAERERLSSVSLPEQRQTVDTTYPLLGQHARVQGSVVLQAVIGADGAIENLRVLSGPSILATAAQQAVRQWRFKPYLQNGQPVETKTTITVNFSIRVADNPAKAS
jgi:protein TonB